MRINKILIKNYRQFKDVELNFPENQGKNFTIIKGNNGTGKTTLLNALCWCLYGYERYGDDESAMSLCNNKSLNLADINETIVVCVQIDFIEDNGSIMSVKRSLKFRKINENKIIQLNNGYLEVISQEGEVIGNNESAEFMINSIIPREILDYFLFDGSRLTEYFTSNSNKGIKDAIFELSQLNLLFNVSRKMEKVESKYIAHQKKLNPELSRINQQIHDLFSQRSMYKQSLNESKNELEEIKRKLRYIDDQLLKLNGSYDEDYILRREEISNRIGKLNQIIGDADNKRRLLVLKNYPYVLTYNYFNDYLKYVNNEIGEKPFIPLNFKKEVLLELIDEGTCICGADLSEDNVHREAILKLLQDETLSNNQFEELMLASTHIKEIILRKIKSIKNDLIEIRKVIVDTQNELASLHQEREELDLLIKNHPQDKFKQLIDEKSNLENLMMKSERNIGRCESEVNSINRQINQFNKEKNKRDLSQAIFDENNEKIDLIRKSIDAINVVKSEFSENIRLNIEELTKMNFIKLQWKSNEFTDIKINEDYDIKIRNSSGEYETPQDLSEGEKLCLGFCFTSALRNFSGFKIPIIIDSPLADLDVDMRKNVAQFLPEFVEDTQVILLVTGSEYTDDFKNSISDYVNEEYLIEWNNSKDGKESKVILNE